MDTKTAEEMLERIKRSSAVVLESVYHSWDDLTIEQQNDLWPFVVKAYANEVVSPLKKRIEELERALEVTHTILVEDGHHKTAYTIEKLINPSTNGKQD